MKIEIGENNSLLVFLDKKDVGALHLDLSDGFDENAPSRKILNGIYRDAALSSGFVPESAGSKTIEILPFDDGSVLICFSFKTKKVRMKIKARLKSELIVYEFSDSASLEQFLESAESLNEIPESVYENEGYYRFLIKSESKSLENLLKEFALKLSLPYTAERTKEFWRRVYS